MAHLRKPYAYSKMEMEDPEDVKHRKAQFLIYKTLEKSPSPRRRPSWLRVRICKLKIKIGRRMKRLKKSLFSSVYAYKVRSQCVASSLKRLFGVRQGVAKVLPPLCT